jgi:Protein of unknown function (DUF1566)
MKTTNMRTLWLGMLLMVSAAAHAQQLPQLPQFQPNTKASAAEVNANFETLRGGVNANEGRVNTLESSVANLPAGPAGPQGPAGPAGPAGAACPPSAPRFTDMGDGTICDGNTGLMWEKKLAADGSEGGSCADVNQANRSIRCVHNAYTWGATGNEPDGTLFTDFLARKNRGESASADGLSITQAGYTDWRIPNIVELRGILLADFPICPSSPCIDGTFGPTQASGYWSSSSLASGPSNAWLVNFGNGVVNTVSKSIGLHARAVRGGR